MNGCHILIVDDDTVVTCAYKTLFEGMGATVDTASDFNRAKTLIENQAYDVVLSDLRLSGTCSCEGFEIVRLARNAFPRAQIIMVTAEDGDEVREKALRLGADQVFEKPICPMDILKHIQNEIRSRAHTA